ncbi:hypothetical protein LCGC14_2184510 [marine sediment metagenome]|uniref:Transmembrane protein n=1 Tax=marine sediment metagenome TaxID=412755 RepID=A0A0F9E8D7_9ZZZZ
MHTIVTVIVVVTAIAAAIVIMDFWWTCVMKVWRQLVESVWESRGTAMRDPEESRGPK